MKRFAIHTIALLACTLLIHAQNDRYSEVKPLPESSKVTAAKVLDHFVEVTGGKEAYEKLKSLSMEAEISLAAMNIRGNMHLQAKAPNRLHTRMEIPGLMVIEQGFDGETGWNKDLLGLRKMEGVELANFAFTADFAHMVNWRESYETTELMGETVLNDSPVYVLRLKPKGEASEMVNFYEQKSGLMVRTDQVQQTPTETVRVETTMSDYRDVDGMKAPFKLEQKLPHMTAVTTIKSVAYNIDIPDALFAMPKQ